MGLVFNFIEYLGGKDLDNATLGFIFMIISMPYLIFGLIYAIDFVFMGPFKKIKEPTISKIYFVIYRFFNIITLSFLYRSLVYNFIDNKYARRFVWLSIPFFILVFILIPGTELRKDGYFLIKESNCNNCANSSFVNWQFYDDLRTNFLEKNMKTDRSKTIIQVASLSSYELSSGLAKIFIPIDFEDNKYLEKVLKIQKKYKTGIITIFQNTVEKDTIVENVNKHFDDLILEEYKLKRNEKSEDERCVIQMKIDNLREVKYDSVKSIGSVDKRRFDAFKSMFTISIDSIDYTDSLQCYWYIHPNQGERGMMCSYSTESITIGNHVLTLERKRHDEIRGPKLKEIIDTFKVNKYEFPLLKLK